MGVKGTLGMLGCGNMGTAILRGLYESGTIAPAQTFVHDVDSAKTEALHNLGANVAPSAELLARESDRLVLATKPQDMDSALHSIKLGLSENTLVISIAAGISSAYIVDRLDARTRVARVMPNTPALVGAGASALAFNENCSDDDARTATLIFASFGTAVTVAEENMDAVTALSGSGPAYFFYLVECLVDAATKLGLQEEDAKTLAGQTLFGAGKLLVESGESAAALRERVTSKGGTTAAALDQFQKQDLCGVIRAGVEAAAARSQELGK